jgi:cytoskeletal protein CcmA (bactofilin family)
MWKPRPEDTKSPSMNPSTQPAQPQPPLVAAAPQAVTPQHRPAESRNDVGHIGKSVQIRGELTGSEDLYLDGEIEGKVDLRDHTLIIGPNGKIKANVTARDLVVHGKVEGNVTASGRVELRKSSTLIGDVSTERIVIEDGAFFKGAIDIKQKDAKAETRKPLVAAAAAGAGMAPAAVSYSMTPGTQGSFSDHK